MSDILVIYHANCADGFTAAWAAWKYFGANAEYYPATHGNPPPDVAGKHVVIVDFCFKRGVLDEMAEKALSILVLDHHKTAAADLAGIATPKMPWEDHIQDAHLQDPLKMTRLPYIRALFDMERSGAGITWDFFHSPDSRPDLVNYVEDRDLWRFSLSHSREVNAYIFAHEYAFFEWDRLCAELTDIDRVSAMGAAIEKKHHKDVRELVEATRRKMIIGGHLVPVANIPYTLTSDAGHLMCQGVDEGLAGSWIPPFAACYWDTSEGRVFSLRSSDDGLDVSEIAGRYGGGGHAKAAGFRMPIGWEGDAAAPS